MTNTKSGENQFFNMNNNLFQLCGFITAFGVGFLGGFQFFKNFRMQQENNKYFEKGKQSQREEIQRLLQLQKRSDCERARIFVEKEPERLKNLKLGSQEYKLLDFFLECKKEKII